MRAFQILVVFLLLTLATSLAQADGLFYKLPKDGTWATYQVTGSGEEGGKRVMSLKGKVRMACVGQVTEGGQLCRWIEVVSEVQFEGKEGGPPGRKDVKDVVKVLVPEKFLAKGETPLDHAIRAWQRRGEKGEPQNLRKPKDFMGSPLPVFMSGPLKDPKPLPKAEVESKLGKVTCEGVAGSLDITGPGTLKMRYSVENRLHPDAPFGVVSSRLTGPISVTTKTKATKVQKGTIEEETPVEETPVEVGKMELNLNLIDFGDKATSEMPDAK
jgi:hypothetical protein